MKQKMDGLFDAQEKADREAREAEIKRLCGWTKERAKEYNLGHSWADPDAYPPVAELRRKEPLQWEVPYDFPLGKTPKAAANRLAMIERYRRSLDECYAAYESQRTRAEKPSRYEASLIGDDLEAWHRESLALRYNHCLSTHAWLAAMEAAMKP